MDISFFGLGLDRILLIALVAVIVFGPDKLPLMARQAGKWVNELRKLTQDARSEIQNLTKEIDLDEFKKVQSDLADLRKDLSATGKDLMNNLQDVKKEVDIRDLAGNLLAQQTVEYSSEVKELPEALLSTVPNDGTIIIEETIKRETIIQNLVETAEPASETVTTTTTSWPQAETHHEKHPGVPQLNSYETVAATPAAEPTYHVREVNGNGANGNDSSGLRRDMLSLEAQVQTNRQEVYEQIEALERRFLDRLDRIEQRLGSLYEEAGQTQGG